MFRISKSDDPVEDRYSEDETADQDSPPSGSASTVASSALRWLRKGQKLPGSLDERSTEAADAKDIGFFRPAEREEELELTRSLGTADLGDVDLDVDNSEVIQSREPSSAPAEAVQVQLADHGWTAGDISELSFEFDDDDDIDDFDDLGDIDTGLSPRPGPLEKTSFFPEIDLSPDTDLGDTSTSDDRDEPAPLSVDPVTSITEAAERDDQPPPVAVAVENVEDDQGADTDEPAVPALSDPEPLLEEPILRKASRTTLLEETPTGSLESSLALQPIPELQSEPPSSIAAAPQSAALLEINDETVDPVDDGREFDDADAIDANDDDEIDDDDDAIDDDDDDPDASLTEADVAGIDMLDLEGLELDSLEMDTSDQADDQVADDWHAHMADVLAGSGALHESTSSSAEDKAETPERIERSTSVVPLSKTLAEIAATSEPAALPAKLPVPMFMTKTVRQKTAAGQPPSTLPADMVDLSPSQLALSIITNVPRLRRFAAVQIGDEVVADRLVQSTIETALANPTALRHAVDLGLALITLFHQHRQKMLTSASVTESSPETARAFETALCRGLAGADQFELHQFAQGINGLDEKDRELLVLVALENLAYDQIANVIQAPARQILSMVSAARMRLRQALAADDPGTGDKPSAIGIAHSQEIEIHGYLDGELDGHHMADIDALVEYDEDAADRLLHYGIQGDLIRRLYAPLLNRPIPVKMLDAIGAAARPARRGFGFGARRALTAGAFILILGAAMQPLLVPTLSSSLIPETTAITSVATTERLAIRIATAWNGLFEKTQKLVSASCNEATSVPDITLKSTITSQGCTGRP